MCADAWFLLVHVPHLELLTAPKALYFLFCVPHAVNTPKTTPRMCLQVSKLFSWSDVGRASPSNLPWLVKGAAQAHLGAALLVLASDGYSDASVRAIIHRVKSLCARVLSGASLTCTAYSRLPPLIPDP